MPVIFSSEYQPSFFFRNSDINTIYPNLFRKFHDFKYRRERIKTSDGDFLDLDYSFVGSRSAVIICHGLEGNSFRHYMIGMVKALNRENVDAISFNFRGCSGEPNKLPYSYHSGFTIDLHEVIHHVQKKYSQVYLVGFSLGGNVILKYLGDKKYKISKKIKKAVVFSVPCDLAASSKKIAKIRNYIYSKRFLMMLIKKIKEKMKIHPELIHYKSSKGINSIIDFDNCYTAKLHGFNDADDYYRKCSSKYYIKNIKVPTQIISALDDPFLTEECYPISEAIKNNNVTLTLTEFGGHMGYVIKNSKETWLDRIAVEILRDGKNKNLTNIR